MHPLLLLLPALTRVAALPANHVHDEQHTRSKGQHNFCGTHSPPQALLDQARVFKDRDSSLYQAALTEPININLYMHIIISEESERPTNASLEKQLTVLRQAYKPHFITFIHINTSTTINSS